MACVAWARSLARLIELICGPQRWPLRDEGGRAGGVDQVEAGGGLVVGDCREPVDRNRPAVGLVVAGGRRDRRPIIAFRLAALVVTAFLMADLVTRLPMTDLMTRLPVADLVTRLLVADLVTRLLVAALLVTHLLVAASLVTGLLLTGLLVTFLLVSALLVAAISGADPVVDPVAESAITVEPASLPIMIGPIQLGFGRSVLISTALSAVAVAVAVAELLATISVGVPSTIAAQGLAMIVARVLAVMVALVLAMIVARVLAVIVGLVPGARVADGLVAIDFAVGGLVLGNFLTGGRLVVGRLVFVLGGQADRGQSVSEAAAGVAGVQVVIVPVDAEAAALAGPVIAAAATADDQPRAGECPCRRAGLPLINRIRVARIISGWTLLGKVATGWNATDRAASD